MSQAVIVAEFVWNQDYIAQNLCENIDKPVLKCNGKCQLAKELEQNEEKKSNQTIPEIEVSFFIMNDFHFEYPEKTAFITEKTFPNTQSEMILSGIHGTVYHPPC